MSEAQRNCAHLPHSRCCRPASSRVSFIGAAARAASSMHVQAGPKRAELDGEQVPDSDAGALFGTDHLISFMLTHFYLLYAGVILFSAAELIVGAMLMTGLLTRVADCAPWVLSVADGDVWLAGRHCIDEWTMAACNLAMGAKPAARGSGAYSLRQRLASPQPALAGKQWFRWMSGSLPLPQTIAASGSWRWLCSHSS